MPTSQEMRVQNTFDKAMDQINRLQKVFRDEGGLAKAVVDIGGGQDFGAIQEAFDNLYGALEDAHYDAMAQLEVESVKQKLGMTEDPSKPKFPIEIELAGDSIWDRDEPNPKTVTVTDYKFEKDEEGYVSLYVMHDGPWTIYTDTGFEKEMSEIVGMELSFSEQGMQDDGVAHLEGGEAVGEGFRDNAIAVGQTALGAWMKSKRNPRGTEKMQAKGQDMYNKGVNTLKKNYNDTFGNYTGYKIESVTEAVDQPLIDSVVDQIVRDIEMQDVTAIEELLKSCPEANLRGFLSEVGESVTEAHHHCGCSSSCSCGGNCTPSCNCGPSCNDTSQADVELAILKRNAGL